MAKTIELEKSGKDDHEFSVMRTVIAHKADNTIKENFFHLYYKEGCFVATDSWRMCKAQFSRGYIISRFGFTEAELDELSGSFWEVFLNTSKKIVLKLKENVNYSFPDYNRIFPEWTVGTNVSIDQKNQGHARLLKTIFDFCPVNCNFVFDAIKEFSQIGSIPFLRTDDPFRPIGFVVPGVSSYTEILIMPMSLKGYQEEKEKEKENSLRIFSSIEKAKKDITKGKSIA